jgi:hypothetical protein
MNNGITQYGGGGGGGLTGAENGLHLDGEKVLLGGQLNKNTEVKLFGHNLIFSETGSIALLWDKPGFYNSQVSSLSIGQGAIAGGNFSIAIGREAGASGVESICLSPGKATALADGSIAIGRFVRTLSPAIGSIIIGGGLGNISQLDTNVPHSISMGFARTEGKTNPDLFIKENAVGVGINNPTAYLHIKQGGPLPNHAPLKFSTGPLLTTPELGAVEFDGKHLFLTSSMWSLKRDKILTSNFYVENEDIQLYSYRDDIDIDGVGIETNSYINFNTHSNINLITLVCETNTESEHIPSKETSIKMSLDSIKIKSDNIFFSGDKISFFSAIPQFKQIVSGSKSDTTALTSLLTALSNLGLITNSTT